MNETHCVKRVRIQSYSDPHFSRIFPHLDWIWRDTEYLPVFSRNAGKCGKNADQNNSEYGLFLRSVVLVDEEYGNLKVVVNGGEFNRNIFQKFYKLLDVHTVANAVGESIVSISKWNIVNQLGSMVFLVVRLFLWVGSI